MAERGPPSVALTSPRRLPGSRTARMISRFRRRTLTLTRPDRSTNASSPGSPARKMTAPRAYDFRRLRASRLLASKSVSRRRKSPSAGSAGGISAGSPGVTGLCHRWLPPGGCSSCPRAKRMAGCSRLRVRVRARACTRTHTGRERLPPATGLEALPQSPSAGGGSRHRPDRPRLGGLFRGDGWRGA